MGKRKELIDDSSIGKEVFIYTDRLDTADDKWEKYIDTRTGIQISIKGRAGAERLMKEGKIRKV